MAMELTGNVAGMLKLLGGGSDVEITQLLSEGVAIAIVKVDENTITLYAPEGGGSEIDVTPALLSGTKIADITIDDNTTPLYAPAPTSVNVNQVLTEGTKIAEIGVNGVTTEIFAPEGGSSINYSTTEHVVGTWIDGSTIYEKTMQVSIASPYVSFDLSSLNINTMVKMEGICKSSTDDFLPLGYSVTSGSQYIVCSYEGSSSTMYVSVSSSMNNYTSAYITLQYTKSV